MENKIFISPPYIDDSEIEHVIKALKSGWVSSSGTYNNDFTSELENHFKSKILLTNSGSSAIHLALKALNIQKEDFILVSNFTFAATAFPILYEKAIPVFIGIEKETWNISPQYLEEAIESLSKKSIKPKALILAYCYGVSNNVLEIKRICEKHQIALIEDAAEALGSTYNATPLGAIGECGIISFNGNKIITTSAGGCLISKNADIINSATKYACQSKENLEYYEHHDVGYNYLSSNILSAIGLAQFKKLHWKINKRRENFKYYKNELNNITDTIYQKEIEHAFNNRWLSSFVFEKGLAKIIKEKLQINGVEARYLWNPLHLQKAFKSALYFGDSIENEFFINGLSLPSGDALEKKQLEMIMKIIKTAID